MRKKRLNGHDWQAASELVVHLAEDEVFVRLLKQLRENPTHHNHSWSEPDDFTVAVEGCRRCEAFFALPFTILQHAACGEEATR